MEQRFELDVSASRPVLRLDHLFPGCTALIDTGALFPVWTKNRDLLEALGAKICKRNVLFSGFGGNVSGDIYTFTLQLGNLIYPEMHIMACENNDIPGYFIFSATMFKNTVYTIDDIEKKFIIVTQDHQICRNIIIKDENGIMHVLCETAACE